jgi:fructose-1-phosphate kinase PfkB-like protein
VAIVANITAKVQQAATFVLLDSRGEALVELLTSL